MLKPYPKEQQQQLIQTKEREFTATRVQKLQFSKNIVPLVLHINFLYQESVQLMSTEHFLLRFAFAQMESYYCNKVLLLSQM